MALKMFYTAGKIEAGCDEAGRGCLAGPVIAAAVILPSDFKWPSLNDSKKMTEREREQAEPYIKENAIAWAIGFVDQVQIDQINILNASILAMQRALDQLKIIPQQILVDGNRFKQYKDIPHHCIIKGDGKYFSIAAASVLAKVERDRVMTALHEQYPMYAWSKNKGYPTQDHRAAIKKHGPCEHHRLTFNLLGDNQLSLDF